MADIGIKELPHDIEEVEPLALDTDEAKFML